MPIFLEPDQRFPIVLDSDLDKPIESRPTFYAVSQSMRGQRKIAAVLDRMFDKDDQPDIDELYGDAVDLLGSVLVGWKNMGGIEFSEEALEDVLDYMEARELMRKIANNQHVTKEEKKSSE